MFEDPVLEPIVLCQSAYNDRQSRFMKQLKALSEGPPYKSSKDAIHHTFALVRHCIGRLGHHFRAAKDLVSSASRLKHLFDDFEVQPIPTPPRSAPPQMDGKTRLDSLIVRMLPANSPDLANYKQALEELDATIQLSARILEAYENPTFRPRVHAEIQVLEHFYEGNFSFADSDKYIACSKPACYCCFLYFRHHPGNFVEPPSHRNVHLAWRPPDLKHAGDTVSYIHHRDILNSMIADIRKDAFQQILQRRPSHMGHPASVTGITESIQVYQARELDSDLDEVELTDSSDDLQLFLEEGSTIDSDTTDSDSPSHISEDSAVENVRSPRSPDLIYSDGESESEAEGGVLL